MATTNLLITKVKATSLMPAQEVDIWYGLLKALETLCDQLDADGGVTDEDHASLCFDAIINTVVQNSQGNRAGVMQAEKEGSAFVSPMGFTADQRHWLMYNYVNAWETLCEKLDAGGGVTDTDYEALWFTATFLHVVKDPKGVTDLGNGTVFYFHPGATDRKQLIEWYYNAIYSMEGLTTKLDSDGGVTDTDYEANCYTEYCAIQVENAAASVTGNATYN